MDYTEFLPVELFEKIFSYLNGQDLVNCAQVSVRWRETSNSNKLWRPVCKKLSCKDPFVLSNMESNFSNRNDRFNLPFISERLSTFSEWKLCYYQQRFVSHNWYQGYYCKHKLDVNIIGPSEITFASNDRLFFPVVERIGQFSYRLSVIRIDGKPFKICRLEENMKTNIFAACVEGNTFSYVIENILKVTSYEDGGFNVMREYDLLPSVKEVGRKKFNEIQASTRFWSYFICMNSDYVIAGHKWFYFYIWDRKTGNKISFFECPLPKTVMSSFCLHGDRFYFAVTQLMLSVYPAHNAYEYNIEEKRVSLFCSSEFLIKKILSNELYLIIAVDMYRGNNVLIYDRSTRQRLNNFKISHHGKIEQKLLLTNDLLFCYDSGQITVMFLPSCELKTKIALKLYPLSYSVRENLIILRTCNRIQVWDWERGILLYAPSLDYDVLLFHFDSVRLIVRAHSQGRADVIGFW